jgi:hypothetical protein
MGSRTNQSERCCKSRLGARCLRRKIRYADIQSPIVLKAGCRYWLPLGDRRLWRWKERAWWWYLGCKHLGWVCKMARWEGSCCNNHPCCSFHSASCWRSFQWIGTMMRTGSTDWQRAIRLSRNSPQPGVDLRQLLGGKIAGH